MRLLHLGLVFALTMAGFADTVTLRDGRVLNGNYLGGTPRQVRLDMGDRIETLDVGDIVRIEFGGQAAAPDRDPWSVPRRTSIRCGTQWRCSRWSG